MFYICVSEKNKFSIYILTYILIYCSLILTENHTYTSIGNTGSTTLDLTLSDLQRSDARVAIDILASSESSYHIVNFTILWTGRVFQVVLGQCKFLS